MPAITLATAAVIFTSATHKHYRDLSTLEGILVAAGLTAAFIILYLVFFNGRR